MTNYDAESDEVRAAHREAAERSAAKVRHAAAVDFGIDEGLDPTDPYENAVFGQLGDDVDSETLASWNLRRIRQVLGLSQQQVSDKLAAGSGPTRLSQSQLAKIERGERPWRLNEMFDLAEALGIDYFEFFGDQRATDERSLQVLAARLRYQASIEAADRAEEAYKEVLQKQFKAGLKLVHTSAYLGVKDETALRVLAGQADIAEEVQEALQEIGVPAPEVYTLPHVQARLAAKPDYEKREKAAREWAEKEWERLAAEAKETVKEIKARKVEEGEGEQAE